MGVAAVMLVLFYISALKAGRDVTQELAGTTHWLVFPFVQAFTFTAGMSILMTGVRMFLSEITAAFVSISEKFIPNSRPALDVPTVFPFAPTAVIVGFLSSYVAGLLGVLIMVLFNFPVVIIPAAHICFSPEEQPAFWKLYWRLAGSDCRVLCHRAVTRLFTNSSLPGVW